MTAGRLPCPMVDTAAEKCKCDRINTSDGLAMAGFGNLLPDYKKDMDILRLKVSPENDQQMAALGTSNKDW